MELLTDSYLRGPVLEVRRGPVPEVGLFFGAGFFPPFFGAFFVAFFAGMLRQHSTICFLRQSKSVTATQRSSWRRPPTAQCSTSSGVSTNNAATMFTPGAGLKITPQSRVSPYVAAGGGSRVIRRGHHRIEVVRLGIQQSDDIVGGRFRRRPRFPAARQLSLRGKVPISRPE
jgi:hypothetical protein